ncbi:hypothetical protein GCM10023069_25880 [Shinella granuli]
MRVKKGQQQHKGYSRGHPCHEDPERTAARGRNRNQASGMMRVRFELRLQARFQLPFKEIAHVSPLMTSDYPRRP